MIINLVGKGSYNPSENSDLNVTSKDIMKDKVSISKDGTPIVGEAPFEYLGTEDGVDNYRVLEDEMYVLRPMNCPEHMIIYKSTLHSYRDLPIRIAEIAK